MAFERAFQGRRYGDGRATILGGALVGTSGQPVRALKPSERVAVRVRFRVEAPIDGAIAGFLVRNNKGETIFASNTARENYPIPLLAAGEIRTVEFHWDAPRLAPGAYSISIGIADGNLEQYTMCDYLEDAIGVTVGAEYTARGYFQLRCAAVTVRHN